MILMVGLCKFYFAFTHGYFAKQVFHHFPFVVVVGDLLVRCLA